VEDALGGRGAWSVCTRLEGLSSMVCGCLSGVDIRVGPELEEYYNEGLTLMC
jgi:hypothetical protein